MMIAAIVTAAMQPTAIPAIAPLDNLSEDGSPEHLAPTHVYLALNASAPVNISLDEVTRATSHAEMSRANDEAP